MAMVVDLSVLLTVRTPVYPGDPKPSITVDGLMERDGYTSYHMSLGNHIGTHIDAPLHMIAGGKAINDFPVDKFIGPGKLIPLSNGIFDLNFVRQSQIEPGDIVLFHTGMSERYVQPDYFSDYPVISEDIAHYLVDRKVSMVGVDAASVDNTEGFPIHKILLGSEVLVIENLCNLTGLTNSSFMIYALPLKLAIDGAPARVVAQLTSDASIS